VGVCVLQEKGFEVGTAGGQHNLVRPEGVAGAGQGDVCQSLSLQQTAEHIGQVGGVVVPPEAELLVQVFSHFVFVSLSQQVCNTTRALRIGQQTKHLIILSAWLIFIIMPALGDNHELWQILTTGAQVLGNFYNITNI